ncbi:pyridoxal 5'-phosphate synthase glutaminase subunit PdxT [Candidatus Bandiella euplotis]|uniref:glutaminase n=1 Tax=Candidatus Bandiella euplotis TaxID=1664265 RepID=A0ABZ0UN91_9RICK|nr:pyridoxal 5'-phosphate synthase glutaminase subunit PdxT [Candidatus Bandiella woodruffii]WPX96736.1 Glutamine amidotransferase subunit PdxT [Candidatus Bandiella woodruffii]
MKTIGVILYQGAGHLHMDALGKLGFNPTPIYAETNLTQLDGLILPGGESSVQYAYCLNNGLDEKIRKYASLKKPILGTCAGAILLSKYSSEKVKGFGLIDVNIIRNFYGRQIKSATVRTDYGNEAIFIRAPKFINVNLSDVEVIDSYAKQPIFIKQNNIYCTTFHPELGRLDQNNIISKIYSGFYN